MNERILYERVKQGKRTVYKAVGTDRFVYLQGDGVYLSVVDGNCTSIRHAYSTPDLAALDGALRLFVNDLARILAQESRGRPPAFRSAQERRAFAAYCAVLGDEATLTLTVPSAQEIAEKAAESLRQRILDSGYHGPKAVDTSKPPVEDPVVKNHGYTQLRRLKIPVREYSGHTLTYVRNDELREGLKRAGLDESVFNKLFGVQTCSDLGPYPHDVEAVLERMMSGKKTGTQAFWD